MNTTTEEIATEEITLSIVRNVLRKIGDAKNVESQDDMVTFTYMDKDGDNVLAFVRIEADERLFCTLLLPIPKDYFVTAMICANVYNSQKDAHGTFAFAVKDQDDDHFIAVEAHLLSRGGISEQALKHFFKNFIGHIDRYESIMIPAIQELGPDSSFLKSEGWGVFWEAVGSALLGAARA